MSNRILIVDDEIYIRKGLKALIERSEFPFSVIEECDNGKSALDRLTTEVFELLIVDIRMPYMDGITLLKELKMREIQIQIIILSGYDDFSYAKEAMKYGAGYYLVKPIDRTELDEALDKVKKEIERTKNAKEKGADNKDSLSQLISNELNYILLNENLSLSEVQAIFNTLGLDIINEEFFMAVLNADFSNDIDCNGLLSELSKYVEEYLYEQGHKVIVFNDKEGNIVILSAFNQYESLYEYIYKKAGVECFIGVDKGINRSEGFRNTYINACYALKHRFTRNTQYVLRFEELPCFKNDFKIYNDLISKVSEMIGTDRQDEIGRIINQIFDNSLVTENGLKYLEKTVESINQIIILPYIKFLSQYTKEIHESQTKIQSIYNYRSLSDYTFNLKNLITLISDYAMELKKEYKEKNSIDIAIQWLHENFYREDLTMSLVANQVSLNYSYFSLAFKEKTGMSFVSYLKKLRIEKAKELLKSSGMRINEISRKVGFQSPRLFTKSFREEVGISPVEYSKKPF